MFYFQKKLNSNKQIFGLQNIEMFANENWLMNMILKNWKKRKRFDDITVKYENTTTQNGYYININKVTAYPKGIQTVHSKHKKKPHRSTSAFSTRSKDQCNETKHIWNENIQYICFIPNSGLWV